ncbi:MAG TPA: hypothetical protein VNJ01_00095 [Bacteriovoracaceae bacterium]|nr:hypothetical protein [Bacteriovoracaceae bacterium]
MHTRLITTVFCFLVVTNALAAEVYSCWDKKKITYEIEVNVASGEITIQDDDRSLLKTRGSFVSDCGRTSYAGMACYRKFYTAAGVKSGYLDSVENTIIGEVETIFSLKFDGHSFKGNCFRIQ